MTQFTDLQLKQMADLSIDVNDVENQLKRYKIGFPTLAINRPASVGDGIAKLTPAELSYYTGVYDDAVKHKSIVKFVPASGAASRMFKELFAFVEQRDNNISENAYIATFIKSLPKFAFYKLLAQSFLNKGENLQALLDKKQYVTVISELIEADALNYGGLPKGLLEFHTYDAEARTPLEEHFAEGAMYAVGNNNTVYLHFTVTPEHQPLFENKVAQIQPVFEAKYGVTYHVSYSQQLKDTDTIAVTTDNEPFIEDNGKILLRPAGHGALLENLNALNADIVFIKNIDNVVPDRLKETTVIYKKAIGGVLLAIQQKVNKALALVTNECNLKTIIGTKLFIEQELHITLVNDFSSYTIEEQGECLKAILNRPIRVCGMVENKGEPGGGPFFVENKDGSVSLQIGEMSQVDLEDAHVRDCLKYASHFNPVDVVCAITDANSTPFNLVNYRDNDTGFITTKSKNGRVLKAQELPGLWNGAMADWITLFVEVPLITFNPVKTVNDLLREEHQ